MRSLSFLLIVLMTSVYWVGASPSSAQPNAQYLQRTWSQLDGLPHNEVISSTQSTDGFLYVGTGAGLARFDGVRFEVYDRQSAPWLSDHFITALAALPNGDVLVGTRNGLFESRAGVWAAVEMGTDGPHYVRTLLTTRDGAHWVGTYGDGIVRLLQDEAVSYGSSEGLPDLFIRSMVEDSTGVVWAASTKGVIRLASGAIEVYGEDSGLGDPFVRSLAIDQDDRLWAGTDSGAIYRLEDAKFMHVLSETFGEATGSVNDLEFDRSGQLWLASDTGLFRVGLVGPPTVRQERTGRAWSVFEDRNDSLWVGSREGLVKLSVGEVLTVDGEENSLSVRSVAEDGSGRIWVGADRAGVRFVDQSRLKASGDLGVGPEESVRSLAFDSQGGAWVATESSLVRKTPRGLERLASESGLSGRINVLTADPDGVLYAGTGEGLRRWTGDGFEAVDGLPDGLRVRSVEASDGLLVGTESGLYRLRGNALERFTTDDGLPSDFVLTIHRVSSGTVWLGTPAGLAVLIDDSIQAVNAVLSNTAIFQILEDGDGALWMCSQQGIWRLTSSELQATLRGEGTDRALRLAEAEGMASRSCNGGSQPAGANLDDGRLAFATASGVVIVDPQVFKRGHPAPAAVFESLLLDGEPFSLDRGSVLPAGSRNLEFRYTAPSFRSPGDLRFRYRLEGFELDWIEAGQRRQAFFTNLEPGDYKFVVQAASERGAWDGDAAEFTFAITPHPWEARWFTPAIVLALGLLVFALVRARTRNFRNRQLVLEATVAERTQELQVANRALETLARVDELTGLMNYRSYRGTFSQEFGRAMRQQRRLSLILLDIDYFKRFNDTYGHSSGDDCLRRVARSLRSEVRRGGDFVARHGGEEFVVILPEVEESEAVHLATRILRSVEELKIPNTASGVSEYVTLSAGVASLIPRSDVPESVLFELADAALYDAKHDGRNRVSVRRALRAPTGPVC